MSKSILPAFILLAAGIGAYAQCSSPQTAANVSQVIISSTVTCLPIQAVTASNGATFTPTATTSTHAFNQILLNVFSDTQAGNFANNAINNNPSSYAIPAGQAALSSALSANIAVALSVIPVESPTSGYIYKTEPTTGQLLPVTGTLGPIFTKRAETIGKGKFYFGVTHQDYHFTSFNGQSLNGMSILYAGNQTSNIQVSGNSTATAPATINLALDVRLSQDLAFLTYGVTNHFDVSLGVPLVHSAVASTAYNGVIYAGTGVGLTEGGRCWCVDTFTPGSFALALPGIGSSSLGKTGIGDVVLRFKDAVLERPNVVLAVGADLRLPTGDAQNYLGTGTTSIKPFAALSLYKALPYGIVFAPHADVGWQYFGRSVLGGTLQGTPQTATLSDGSSVNYYGPPFTSTKGYLPTIFSWAVGTEVALGRSNTVIADVIGNEIGWGHGIQTLQSQPITCTWQGVNNNMPFSCPAPAGAQAMTSSFTAAPSRSSFGQYSGAFGYKRRVFRGLVATFQVLVRFDNNGLVARVAPLYGLGYDFGQQARARN
jgi:hypothetical protein